MVFGNPRKFGDFSEAELDDGTFGIAQDPNNGYVGWVWREGSQEVWVLYLENNGGYRTIGNSPPSSDLRFTYLGKPQHADPTAFRSYVATTFGVSVSQLTTYVHKVTVLS